MKPTLLIALLAIFELAACASSPTKRPNAVAEPVSADKALELAAEQQRLHDIIVFNSQHYGRSQAELRDVIAAPAFKSLGVDDEFEALTLAAGATPSEIGVARGYLDRAIALPGIGFNDQLSTLRLSVNSGSAAAAAKSLTLLARRWPDQIGTIDNQLILRALSLTSHVARGDRLLMLQALYAAHWKLKWDIEPSPYWRDLALFLVEQGSVHQAIDVSMHIADPYVLVSMRADRRFDSVVAAHPNQFDVEAAADRELKFFQSLSDEHPKSLALKVHVMEALQREQHYAAMLAASDSAVQEIRSTNFPDKLYDDYVEEHGAYFYLRSVALRREGQWDEAIAQLVVASHEGDINQLVNLAFLYCELDQPKDALALVGTIGRTRTSPYGAMQVDAVKLQSAVQLGDHNQILGSLNYLSEHRADSPDAYMMSLVVTKQLDTAAKYLVGELQDRDLRQNALLDVQEYPLTPGSKTELEFDAQWRSIVARKEVRAAIRKVGRVESYRLEAP